MRFTAQEEYGLRCMLQFARHLSERPGSDGDRSLTIGEIAEIEGITPQYAGKLIRILRMGGLLASVRGRHGGYKLARPIDQISVGEVLAVLGGRVFQPGYCTRYTGDKKLCVHSIDCALRSLWGGLQDMVDRVLSRIKLIDMISSEKGVTDRLVPLTRHSGSLFSFAGISGDSREETGESAMEGGLVVGSTKPELESLSGAKESIALTKTRKEKH